MKKPLVLAATVTTLALTLSACGSSSGSDGSANANTGAPSQQGMSSQGGTANRTFPGASGKVAAVSGKTAQVQSSDSQTAVTWNASTSFTQEKTVAKSAVKVGSCVMAMPSMPARGSDASGSPGTGSSSSVAAATVRIISSSGDCTSGFGGRRPGAGAPSGMPSGAPSGMPSGAPSGMPSGGPGGRGMNGGMRIAVGEVVAVSGSGFTVKSSMGGQTSKVKVTTSAKTSYTENAKASAAAVKVGLSMSAQGKTDSTGAVTARQITLSKTTNGTCTSGFGGGMPGGMPGQSGGSNGNGNV